MSSALRRLTGIVSVNVLMWHQAGEIVVRVVSEFTIEKKLILILFPFPTESVTICSPH